LINLTSIVQPQQEMAREAFAMLLRRIESPSNTYSSLMGQLASTNAEQVSRIRTILEALNFEIATPDEARQMLGLKGKDNVGF
jgi:hypothetical protein